MVWVNLNKFLVLFLEILSTFNEMSRYLPFSNSPLDTIFLNLPLSILPIRLKLEIISDTLVETSLIFTDISLLIFCKKVWSHFFSDLIV